MAESVLPENQSAECTTLQVVQCGLLYTSILSLCFLVILGALLPNGPIAVPIAKLTQLLLSQERRSKQAEKEHKLSK